MCINWTAFAGMRLWGQCVCVCVCAAKRKTLFIVRIYQSLVLKRPKAQNWSTPLWPEAKKQSAINFLSCFVVFRLRWSLTFSTIRCATNARERAAGGSSRLSSAPTWRACSTTASTAGHRSIRAPAASSTSRSSRRAPTDRALCRSAGARTLHPTGLCNIQTAVFCYQSEDSCQMCGQRVRICLCVMHFICLRASFFFFLFGRPRCVWVLYLPQAKNAKKSARCDICCRHG